MKSVFNKPQIEVTAQLLHQYFDSHPHPFEPEKFIDIASDKLEQRELKDRSEQIVIALFKTLPDCYSEAIAALTTVLLPVSDNQDLKEVTTTEEGVAGWMIMPFTEYVGRRGVQEQSLKINTAVSTAPEADYQPLVLALEAQKQLTKRFTSEFGIRHLLIEYPSKCLKIMESWCLDSCHHVRRLVSEGTRPLLPWAMQLPEFKENPDWVSTLLGILRNDESEYVRRSVANHLNDISKSYPENVNEIAQKWLSESNSNNKLRMVKHACRSLIKAGNVDTLRLFGYSDPKGLVSEVYLNKAIVKVGESIDLSLNIKESTMPLLVDYKVYHLRGRGQHIGKVFKWKEIKAPEKEIKLTKSHSFKPINTRRYYSGTHYVEVLINGVSQGKQSFELIAD